MKLDELVAFIKKQLFFVETFTGQSQKCFDPPDIQCSEWVLLLSPAYGNKGMRGSLVVSADAIHAWASNHVDKSWNSVLAQQQALEHMVAWTSPVNIASGYVTMLDEVQRGVLQEYAGNLIKNQPHRVWCPECKHLYEQFVDATEYFDKVGKESRSIEIWRCSDGHLIKCLSRRLIFL
jgi:hypothetical protein